MLAAEKYKYPPVTNTDRYSVTSKGQPQSGATNYDRLPDTNHGKAPKKVSGVTFKEVSELYAGLSATGIRVILALIYAAPDYGKPFSIIASSLRYNAKCSKLSILRTIPKGEQAGLYQREINKAGRRHGTVITACKERCEFFLKLAGYKDGLLSVTNTDQYLLLPDTKGDRYSVTNTDRYQINFGNRHDQGIKQPFLPLNTAGTTEAFFSRLSDQGKRVFGIICSHASNAELDEISLVIQSVAKEAACSEVTARRVIKHGHDAGIYTKRMHERGPRFGITLKLNDGPVNRIKELLQAFPPQPDTKGDRYPDTNTDQYQATVTNHDRYPDRIDTDHDTKHDRYPDTNVDRLPKSSLNHCNSRANENKMVQPDTNADRYQNFPFLDRKIKNLSNLKIEDETEEERHARRLLSISTDEFQIIWPLLHEKSFGPDQIRQIVEHRLSFEETILDIENSLHAVEYHLEQGIFPQAKKGICNYVFAVLKRTGRFNRPAGFMTPNEKALANAKKEKAVIKELQSVKVKKAK
ncbi:hypothetical protein, partial [Maridesulfovibrio hydrothermalis]